MSTPDGIPSDEWDVIHELAVEIVNAETTEQEETSRRRLMTSLEELESRHGPLPSILATRADFLEDDVAKDSLLQRAYSIAKDRGDNLNALYIAHSLAELHLENMTNRFEARKWLNQLKHDLRAASKPYYVKEYERLRQRAKRLGLEKA